MHNKEILKNQSGGEIAPSGGFNLSNLSIYTTLAKLGLDGANLIFGKDVKLNPKSYLNAFSFGDMFADRKLEKYSLDPKVKQILGGSYAGAYETAQKAEDASGTSFSSIFDKKELNKATSAINKAKSQDATLSQIADKSLKQSEALASGLNTAITRSQAILNGIGSRAYSSILAAKGTKFPEELPETEDVEIIVEESQKFEQGGKMNVIPEGALHARLNNMEVDNITKKGIPVVSEDGGKLTQHAEIERNEIIFTKEITEKLEDLYNKFHDYEYSQKEKDEVAIEAGKILVHEILYNTDDRTGLIEGVELHQQGGTLDLGNKENFVKPTYEDWYNSIPENARADNYDYELAFNTVDLDELLDHAKDPENYHLPSSSDEPDENGNYPFLKLGNEKTNPEIQYELDWYNSKNAEDFRNNFGLEYINDRYYYIPKNNKEND